MPMYAYACKDCGHAFDIQQSFSEDSLALCPACGGALRKKFNSVGVVFKGSGFYRNDSRATSTTTDAGAPAVSSSKPAESSGQGSGSSTPAKPAAPAAASDSGSSAAAAS